MPKKHRPKKQITSGRLQQLGFAYAPPLIISAAVSNKVFDAPEYARAIRAVGPEYCILSSDLGQAGNPLHTDGLVAFFAALRSQGLSESEIDQMSKINPAKLLGLKAQ